MGGNPPLGYDVKDRKLIVTAREAETVRFYLPAVPRVWLGACAA